MEIICAIRANTRQIRAGTHWNDLTEYAKADATITGLADAGKVCGLAANNHAFNELFLIFSIFGNSLETKLHDINELHKQKLLIFMLYFSFLVVKKSNFVGEKIKNMTFNAEKLVPFADRKTDKSEQIEYMFDQIAPKYDRMNHLMTFGIDKAWRKKGLLKLKEFKPQTILDVATGTGDLAIKAFKLLKPKLILGIDISEGMMEIGKQKVAKEGLSDYIKFEWQDCSELQLETESFDAVMMAFGIRNFANPDRALQNILNVMRPGGKLMILELSIPEYFPMKQAYTVYSRFIIPALGHKLAKNQNAYKYLPKSIAAFPQNEVLKAILENNGFHSVKYQKLFPGVCTLYFATK